MVWYISQETAKSGRVYFIVNILITPDIPAESRVC